MKSYWPIHGLDKGVDALARFRSSANACSHSAMPSAARRVNILRYPNIEWPRGWSGTNDRALVNFAPIAAHAERGGAPEIAGEPDKVLSSPRARAIARKYNELHDLARIGRTGTRSGAGWAALRASSVGRPLRGLHTTGLTASWDGKKNSSCCCGGGPGKDGARHVVLSPARPASASRGSRRAAGTHSPGEATAPASSACRSRSTRGLSDPRPDGTRLRMANVDAPQAKLDRLDAVLAQTSTLPEEAALIAAMLSLQNDGLPALESDRGLAPITNAEALRATRGMARKQPVVRILEDAYWIDPTSRKCSGGRRIGSEPADSTDRDVPSRVQRAMGGTVAGDEPDAQPAWRAEQAAIKARLAGNETIPADLMAEIVERTDGIPLFVEEMTKAVLEAETEGAARQAAAAVPFPALAVPASLHASLMARLDRLGPAKEGAQIGAAVGVNSRMLYPLRSWASPRRSWRRARSSHSRRSSFPARRAAAGELPLQARAGAGRRLWHAPARTAAGASRSDRRGAGKPIRRDRREPAGGSGTPLRRGWADRKGGGPMGQGGTAFARPLGAG